MRASYAKTEIRFADIVLCRQCGARHFDVIATYRGGHRIPCSISNASANADWPRADLCLEHGIRSGDVTRPSWLRVSGRAALRLVLETGAQPNANASKQFEGSILIGDGDDAYSA